MIPVVVDHSPAAQRTAGSSFATSAPDSRSRSATPLASALRRSASRAGICLS
jgi:hypothetical protein